MATSVISSEILSDYASPSGRRRVKFRFVCEDHHGDQHEFFKVRRRMDAGWDAAAWMTSFEQTLLDRLADQEVDSLADISSGLDPYALSENPRWAITKRIRKKLTRWWKNNDDINIAWYLETFLDNLFDTYTNPQLVTRLDMTTEQVQSLRRRWRAIFRDTGKTARAFKDDYDIEQEEIN